MTTSRDRTATYMTKAEHRHLLRLGAGPDELAAFVAVRMAASEDGDPNGWTDASIDRIAELLPRATRWLRERGLDGMPVGDAHETRR